MFNQLPHGNSKGREALDLVLALSDIHHISVFFTSAGIFHLMPHQQPDKILMRDYIATLGLLELYEITNLYVCQEALTQFNLVAETLMLDVTIIPKSSMANLLAGQDIILQF